ncbi:N-acetylmuramate alpha-1-phosphate uridylyltransferase MurU [Legionella sp. CNM-4043-24]|uniref:N-acetylmuramate alpha-1-phosphate uridylyltransferase MurU n=1 Tax=Legionella sp. CNM-4043-24 TaxID=3421646 RepID=UPI00403B30CF
MNTAMILAAGRGERLKPLTNEIPKAMCRVKGRPLIEHHVINLARAGFTRLVINHAYLGDQIRRHLGDGHKWNIDILYSPEPPGGLETGGGIVSALPLLGKDPFLTVNADIYTDFPFQNIALSGKDRLHLILVKSPAHNRKGDFGLKNGRLINHDQIYTFSGIACYHPDVFSSSRMGRYSVTPLLRSLAEGDLASGTVFHGQWIDIGTIERLRQANQS